MKQLFAWDPVFEIGIAEIDIQHKNFIELVSEMQKNILLINEAQLYIYFGHIYDYIEYHFTREETLMKVLHYENYLSHKEEHDLFTKKMDQFYSNFEKSLQSFVIVNMVDFMKDWIIGHLLSSDKQFGEYYNKIDSMIKS